MKVHFRRNPEDRRWVYLAVGSWQPFRFMSHGGWIFLDPRWVFRFLVAVPRSRGWRWD